MWEWRCSNTGLSYNPHYIDVLFSLVLRLILTKRKEREKFTVKKRMKIFHFFLSKNVCMDYNLLTKTIQKKKLFFIHQHKLFWCKIFQPCFLLGIKQQLIQQSMFSDIITENFCIYLSWRYVAFDSFGVVHIFKKRERESLRGPRRRNSSRDILSHLDLKKKNQTYHATKLIKQDLGKPFSLLVMTIKQWGCNATFEQ